MTQSLPQQNDRARRYVTIIQAAEGYPPPSEPLEVDVNAPLSPVIHSVVLAEDYEALEARLAAFDPARIANLLRQAASYGRHGLSAAQVKAMCAEADVLDPMPDGPWRPV